jgi:tRNA dimethylallyltransferase
LERRAIIIVGPTCSGKTFSAINLSKRLNTEIISADSRQIYRYLTIGTAKPTKEELNSVVHHLVDSIEPDRPYNISMFENESLEIIDRLHRQNKVPVITGGSGLYVKALVDGVIDVESPDQNYREHLLEIKREKGIDYLHNLLLEIDPKSASAMLPQNWKRVIRAIEVYKLSGRSIVDLHLEQKRNTGINFFQFGLNWERKVLYSNIEKRVDRMINSGLVDEVKSLLDMGFSKNLNSLNTVGYKEIMAYLNGDYTIDRAVELIKRNTRRYAKRQMTWFLKDKRIVWFDIEDSGDLENIPERIISLID